MDGFLIVLLALGFAPAVYLLLRKYLPSLLERAGGVMVHHSLRNHLPESYYRLFDDVWLRTPRGKVHFDHLLVSSYGIFIIATRHDWGWISGSPQDATWTRSLLGLKREFPNPIRLNNEAARSLQSLLDLDESKFHRLSVFTGRFRFRESTPLNVTGLEGMLPVVQVRTEHLVGFEETERVIRLICSSRTTPPRRRVDDPTFPRPKNPLINGLMGAAAGAAAMAALLFLGSQVLKIADDVVHTSPLPAYPEQPEESPVLPTAEKPQIDLPSVEHDDYRSENPDLEDSSGQAKDQSIP